MSAKPIDPDSGLARLVEEGYSVEVRDQHLFLHDVPYVTSARTVSRGSLICTYIQSAGVILTPDNHQVWWTGEYPCFAHGTPIEQVRNEDETRELLPGLVIRHRFSNKPFGISNFDNHYTKVTHYANLLQAQARVVDPEVDARGKVVKPAVIAGENSPFVYADSASTRAEIQATSQRLAMRRIAIVGVGGTGSYILDQISKTPVSEIHLFDGDVFLQHNAFRSPGAASMKEIADQPLKTEYFRSKYDAMHKGIVSHPVRIESSNINDLNGFDFVFLCVDKGDVRRLIAEYLIQQQTPFIDVGMDLQLIAATGKLIGSCRYTLCTPAQSAHFSRYAPLQGDDANAVYRQNIQIADMNALNAQLAVMKWKQFCGFYQDDFMAHNVVFTVNVMSLARDVFPEGQA
ncbi:MAG TPA: ThiF family adenylyltransferase [Methylophilaceae bacterium]|nr:ThiF family adenylyltransferase [Methylophilaceae bacterium]